MSRHRRIDWQQVRDLANNRAYVAFDPVPDTMEERVQKGMGIFLAQVLGDPEAVLHAAADAMEEMNFHDLAAQLRIMAGDEPYEPVPNNLQIVTGEGVAP